MHVSSIKGVANKSVILVGSCGGNTYGPVYESNAIACYGKTFLSSSINREYRVFVGLKTTPSEASPALY